MPKKQIRKFHAKERNMNKIFESNEKVASVPDEPDALIQFHDTPYISYQEINLTQNFDIYFSGILRSKIALRMGVLPSPYQQTFEMNTGSQSLKVLFKGAQRQLEWIEIELVFDKSYQHQTIYHSYDVELPAKLIQSVHLENASAKYSLTGQLEYNVKNEEDMQWLHQMFSVITAMAAARGHQRNIKTIPFIKKLLCETNMAQTTKTTHLY